VVAYWVLFRDEGQFLESRLSLSFLDEVLNSSLFLVLPPPPIRRSEFLVVVDNVFRIFRG